MEWLSKTTAQKQPAARLRTANWMGMQCCKESSQDDEDKDDGEGAEKKEAL